MIPSSAQRRRSSEPQSARAPIRIEKPEISPKSFFFLKLILGFSYLFSLLSIAIFLRAYFSLRM